MAENRRCAWVSSTTMAPLNTSPRMAAARVAAPVRELRPPPTCCATVGVRAYRMPRVHKKSGIQLLAPTATPASAVAPARPEMSTSVVAMPIWANCTTSMGPARRNSARKSGPTAGSAVRFANGRGMQDSRLVVRCTGGHYRPSRQEAKPKARAVGPPRLERRLLSG